MISPFTDKHGRSLTWSQAGRKIVVRWENYWLDFKLWLLWLLGYFPSHTFRRALFSLAGVKLGQGSVIHIGARFYQTKNISVGTDTIIGDHATLDGRAPLTIGDHVAIASEVMIFNSQHDLRDPYFSPIEKAVTIGDYVFIGPRAIILPGVTIGKGAVVAAGAIVTGDVAAGMIVATGLKLLPALRKNVLGHHASTALGLACSNNCLWIFP